MISFLGQCVQNFIQATKYTLKGNVRLSGVVSQVAAIGFDSLGICLSIVFISACVIALQVAKQFLMSGGDSYIGGFLTVALIREIAPGFAALALAARAGTAITAQVANMQVTNQIDAIEVVTTRFKNMMSYKVEKWQILPIVAQRNEDDAEHKIDPLMTFDTDANSILQKIVPFYISNIIYQALLEATASELASRMTAMSSATQSAADMIKILTVDYNKARQAAITNEISEVVSGADALKN